jgi:hypothetical protein
LHDHAVVSDGVFSLDQGVLNFHPTPAASGEDVASLVAELRHRILKRMQRLGVMPREAVSQMLAWPHGVFSLDGGTTVEAHDRAGLERLLLYVLRPALSTKHLTYKPEADRVFYRPSKGRRDSPRVLEWTGAQFVGRMAALIPPARKHLVRYYGALGPRSPLRRAVTMATRAKATALELEAGYGVTLGARVSREARTAARAAARSWAACLKRVFEAYPVNCPKCGTEMKLVAIIVQDAQLDRILAHEGLDRQFPKTKPARPPPQQRSDQDEAGQLDPREQSWDGRQDFPDD